MIWNSRKYHQCRLNPGTRWAIARGLHEHRGSMLVYVCCVRHVFMLKHWFCWKHQYNKYTCMFNLIEIYSCEWLYRYGPPVHCFAQGPLMLLRRPWVAVWIWKSFLIMWPKMKIIKRLREIISWTCFRLLKQNCLNEILSFSGFYRQYFYDLYFTDTTIWITIWTGKGFYFV